MATKKIHKAQREVFFKVLSESGNVSGAALAANIKRRWAEKQREFDADWAEEWEEALETAKDTLRAEIYRRAVVGVLEVALSGGKIVFNEKGTGEPGTPLMIVKYDNKLLEFHSRAILPEHQEWMQTALPPLPADLQPDPKPTPDSDDVPDLIE